MSRRGRLGYLGAPSPVSARFLPADEIAALAEELDTGLVVVGSRGLGTVKRLVVGSVSEGVVSLVPCPVLVMRGGEGAWPPTRMVVGADLSEEARRAAELAMSFEDVLEAKTLLVLAYERRMVTTRGRGDPRARIEPTGRKIGRGRRCRACPPG